MLSPMTERDRTPLQQEVEANPRSAGARLRLGLALGAEGLDEEAAKELLLAARMEPGNPQVALAGLEVIIRAGRERDIALLLSSHLWQRRSDTDVTDLELAHLELLLEHDEAYVRHHTARALGRLRIVRGTEALERGQGDPDAAVRSAVSISLGQLRAH